MRMPGIQGRRGPAFGGAVGALALAVLVAAAVAVPQLRFQASTTEYTAEFANAAGLSSGDQVHVAGVPAGRVTDVELAGDRVRVEFRLDNAQPLGDTTTAAVKLATVLGTRYLAVQPGGSGELPSGTIPMHRTSVPYSLGDIADTAKQTAEQLDVTALRGMISALQEAAPDGRLLGDALAGVGRATSIVGERNDQFRSLLQGVRTLTTSLLDQRETLVTLLGDAGLVAETVNARRGTIRQLITDLDALTSALDRVLRENEPQFGPLLSDLHSITDTLERNDAQLAEVLTKLGPGSRYLANATGNGPWGDVSGPAGPLPDNLLCLAALLEGCR
ncbi:MCE family protein [Prauserella oleivorans]|uniref:MCE family protein n=1 Tax=Prauserella oleivorans TaxID=1478153 RepID=A0ABW5WAU7_9PSEU